MSGLFGFGGNPFHSALSLADLLSTQRRVFVSYQHSTDQYYYDEFSRIFADTYDAIADNSLERALDSDDPDYVMRRIREKHITGTSCTIVLVGWTTWGRKYVDWEIKATLDKCHGLIGVALPSVFSFMGQELAPTRLQQNRDSGYAVWTTWNDLTTYNALYLKALIELARSRSSELIRNDEPMRQRNA